MKKKISILTQYFPPEMGAPQNRLWEATKGLKNMGWDVSVITAMPNYPTGKIFPKYRNRMYLSETIDGVKVYRYWLYPSNSRKSLPRILSMVSFSVMAFFSVFKLLLKRPVYIIVESPPLTLAFTGWLLSVITRSRFILNVSDLWPLSAYELGSISKGRLYRFLEKLEKFLYDKADACLGQSQQIVDYIKGVSSVNTHLFRNGVDISRFNGTAKPEVKADYKIVYAGLLGVAQGIVNIVRTINFKEEGFEFHIYGAGSEQDELEEYLEKKPDQGVIYHGSVPRDEIPQVLQQYDIALVPLVKPIFGAVPSKIYEAMAAGLPIIFMGGGEGEMLIKEHEAGWICAPSALDELVVCLKDIKNLDKPQLVKKQQHAKKVAKDIFDRKMQIAQLDRFLVDEV